MINRDKVINWIIVGVVILMFSPIIIPLLYSFVMDLMGTSVHEGNSAVITFHWFSLITIPAGFILLISLLVGKYILKKCPENKMLDFIVDNQKIKVDFIRFKNG